jgi:hypothetical protein
MVLKLSPLKTAKTAVCQHESCGAHHLTPAPNLLRLRPLQSGFRGATTFLLQPHHIHQTSLKNPIPQDAMGGRSANKSQYFDKLKALLEEYHSIFIVGVDNVSSQQMHEIRHSMRNKGVILMGKNTMVREE